MIRLSVIISLLLIGPVAAQSVSLAPTILRAPWREATISVRAFNPVQQFLVDVGQYEVVAEGEVDQAQIAYWRLPKTANAKFVLLKEPGSDHGYIRLIRFEGVEQETIRVGARAWDPGGYFSLMLRAKNLPDIYKKAVALGFQSESEPVRFAFQPTDGSPPSDLRNVVLKAPDGINFALYERLSPPLSAFWDFNVLSQPFNAMQMVKQTTIAHSFYREELGMTAFWSDDYLDPFPVYNNFGIPKNLTTQIPRRTRILWPQPAETGRLEIMEFVGLEGRSFAIRAVPPNLGILSVSYPVLNAKLAFDLFLDTGGLPQYSLRTFTLAPYGEVRMFTVKSPDGALINVFEDVEAKP